MSFLVCSYIQTKLIISVALIFWTCWCLAAQHSCREAFGIRRLANILDSFFQFIHPACIMVERSSSIL
ncbi:hypothetical protein DVH24_015030 [Malus domestica]|uniref:Uncharacterized protein n=1 Tax=Malus domestica TaxID=3750 RepID=A0A498K267_MALDO|nr:hypothetical protein DVH24_015030 [Malus domestica]